MPFKPKIGKAEVLAAMRKKLGQKKGGKKLAKKMPMSKEEYMNQMA